jgi:hypothetical protein
MWSTPNVASEGVRHVFDSEVWSLASCLIQQISSGSIDMMITEWDPDSARARGSGVLELSQTKRIYVTRGGVMASF